MITWSAERACSSRPAQSVRSGLLVIGVFAAWLSASCSTAQPIGRLDADISFQNGQFVIKNLGQHTWSSFKLTVNDDFVYQRDTPLIVNEVTIPAFELAKPDGTRFNPVQFKPQMVYLIATFPDGKRASYGGRFR